MVRAHAIVAMTLVAAIGCGGGSDLNPDAGPGDGGADDGGPDAALCDPFEGAPAATAANPFQEVFDQGITRYVGVFDAIDPDPEPNLLGTKRFVFDPAPVPAGGGDPLRGPVCLRGSEYFVETREGDSDELMIFLQGGGACWEDLCNAFETAIGLVPFGVLSNGDQNNPFHDWDVVYLPYCDGSLFGGDVDRELEGEMGFQRGLQNLTAALDMAIREFPDPSRVVLTGISGGAFGTITATPLVRFYYPDQDLIVINDSGVGVVKAGQPEFVNGLLEEWNMADLIPDSCSNCTSDGHITGFIQWGLERDPRLIMGALSYSKDSTIAESFLQIDPDQFRQSLLSETQMLEDLFGPRYRRFIIDGNKHTMILSAGLADEDLGTLDDAVGDVSVRDWITTLLEDPCSWESVVDPNAL